MYFDSSFCSKSGTKDIFSKMIHKIKAQKKTIKDLQPSLHLWILQSSSSNNHGS